MDNTEHSFVNPVVGWVCAVSTHCPRRPYCGPFGQLNHSVQQKPAFCQQSIKSVQTQADPTCTVQVLSGFQASLLYDSS